MKRTHAVPKKFLASMLALIALLIMIPGATLAQTTQNIYLVAKEFSMTMPDSAAVPMWGFAQAANNNCPATDILEGPSAPGPKIIVTDPTLTITLCNELEKPVSIVIPGQTAIMIPRLEDDGTGRMRVKSFTTETPPTDGFTYYSRQYTWNNFRPGTYMYQSGTHPQVQVQMGLYGAAVKDHAAHQAYDSSPPADTTAYDRETILFLSEIDPLLHQVVADGLYGISMTSTIDYNPKYFLINGESYSSASVPISSGGLGDRVLIRFLNAGLMTHVPVNTDGHMTLVAEDGNLYPFFKEQYSVVLPALKTIDAIWTPSEDGTVAFYDRRLYLANGGMFINIDACSNLPAFITGTSTGYERLQHAFDAVADLDTIVNRFDIYNEDANYNRNAVTAYLKGKYSCHDTPSDNIILAHGSMTISDGIIIIGGP